MGTNIHVARSVGIIPKVTSEISGFILTSLPNLDYEAICWGEFIGSPLEI